MGDKCQKCVSTNQPGFVVIYIIVQLAMLFALYWNLELVLKVGSITVLSSFCVLTLLVGFLRVPWPEPYNSLLFMMQV